MAGMPIYVARLTERTLETTFSRTPYALVRVDRAPNASFHRGLAEHLDSRFPRLVTFATLSRTDFAPARLGDLFQSAVGKLRTGVSDGYYLFEGGLVVGHHTGQTRPSTVSYGSEADEEAQRARLRATPGASTLPPHEMEALRQIVAYLVPIVERKQRASGFSDDGTATSAPGGGPWVYTTDSPPPPRSEGPYGTPGSAPTRPGPPVDDPEDPHTILGVAVGATEEELKAAYRNQMKLNHPDKVAHLSPALQQFAAQQTLKVKAAYEVLIGRRRG